ncbi:hypothetical protein [Haloarchaeobius sp. DFWS5]|uniref:hypothetical protein n=1 Tax=Haloarchaeobius sp. DFWS5 TaxID=3446114 RepID=UPI003EBD28A2
MADQSKRQFLGYAGAALAAVTLGVGGKLAVDRASQNDAERPTKSSPAAAPEQRPVDQQAAVEPQTPVDPYLGRVGPDGYIDYERKPNGDIDFYWRGMRFQTHEGDRDVEFTATDGGVYVDFESTEDGSNLEFTLVEADTEVTLDVNGRNVELYVVRDGLRVEHDPDELEYEGALVDLEWHRDDHMLEVKGLVNLEWDGDQFDYWGLEVVLDWETGGDPVKGFDARLI